jgi:hypothetical protein
MPLDTLLANHDDPSRAVYRNTLAALSSRGVNVQHTKSGFEIRDAAHVLTVQYPEYANTEDVLEAAKLRLRKALTACGVAEYALMLVSGEEEDEGGDVVHARKSTLTKAASEVRAAFAEYQDLLLYRHIIEKVRPATAQEAVWVAAKEQQRLHFEAVQTALDASTDDASREKMIKQALSARRQYDNSRPGDIHPTSTADTVVISPPVVTEETLQRRAKRDKVMKRNAKVAKKMTRS